MSSTKLFVRVFLAVTAASLFVRPAVAFGANACVAADFGCAAPPAVCVITGSWDIGDGCDLDFGTQDVEIQGTLRADVVSGGFSIRANDLTLDGGKLRSPGDTDDWGGDLFLSLTGDFEMTGSAQIDTGGNGGGGAIEIDAVAVSILGGNILSDGGSGEECDDASTIGIVATGPVVIDGNAVTLKATTPGFHCSGGEITIDAPSIDVRRGLDVSGGSPDGIYLTAETGDLLVSAPAGLTANGRGTLDESGNDAGEIVLRSEFGSIVSDSDLTARGSGPDGEGGDITLDAELDVTIDRPVDNGAGGSDTTGGGIAITGYGSVSINHRLLAKTGSLSSGGSIDIESRGPVTFAAGFESSTDGGEGDAGDISIATSGPVTIAGDLSARGANGGGGGGVDIAGCQISISGDIDARGSGAGTASGVDLTGATIDIAGSSSIEATPCAASDCMNFKLQSGSANVDPGATVDPAYLEIIDPSITPCCGNGIVDDGTGGSASVGEECDDTNARFCDGCTPSCTIEPVPACADDGNECTLDCNPESGCAYQPLSGVPCADEPDACTDDVCQAGVCTHDPITCNDGFACTTDSCDSVAGCEYIPDDGLCDDGESCTTETCEVGQGCVFVNEPDETPCDDNSLCTLDDACQSGVCTGPPPDCDDGNPCTQNNCHAVRGCLNSEDEVACDCLDEGGAPLPAGTVCADGNDCTIGDTCDAAGSCGAGPECPDEDGNACTNELCFFGVCVSTDSGCLDCIEGQPCSDGDRCTTGICTLGVCEPTPIDCDDGDSCTTDACIANYGCNTVNFSDPACTGDPVLDHFSCYKARKTPGAASVFSPILGLSLEDEFWAINVDVKSVRALCAPVNVNGGDPTASSHEDHFEAYKIKAVTGTPKFVKQKNLEVTNQFGTIHVDARVLDRLLVPTSKSESAPPGPPVPPDPDHFECYKVGVTAGTPKFTKLEDVVLEDQFGTLTVDVLKPFLLCNPANKNGEDPTAPTNPEHLLCYKARTSLGTPRFDKQVGLYTANQFGDEQLDAVRLQELCLPSSVTPPPPS